MVVVEQKPLSFKAVQVVLPITLIVKVEMPVANEDALLRARIMRRHRHE